MTKEEITKIRLKNKKNMNNIQYKIRLILSDKNLSNEEKQKRMDKEHNKLKEVSSRLADKLKSAQSPSTISRLGQTMKSDFSSAGSFLKKTGKEFVKDMGKAARDMALPGVFGGGIAALASELAKRKKDKQ